MARIIMLLPALLLLSPGTPTPQDGKALEKASLDLNGFTELGLVRWHRTMEPAVAEGRKTGKPLLVFTSELPG